MKQRDDIYGLQALISRSLQVHFYVAVLYYMVNSTTPVVCQINSPKGSLETKT
jgi:hypothetical protein